MVFIAQDILVLAAGVVTVGAVRVVDQADTLHKAESLAVDGTVVNVPAGLINHQPDTERARSLNMGVTVIAVIPGNIIEQPEPKIAGA